MPKVAIIIPCYNQSVFLEDAVTSVVQQQYQNWECIIVNDCSTDDTVEKATILAGTDERIKLVSTPSNLGLSGARNFGTQHATADYILPLDADDKIAKDYISEAIKVFELEPTTQLVYAKAEFFGALEEPWQLPPFHYGLLFGRNPIYCSAIYKKADWEKCGGYDTSLKRGLEDWDFWLKILGPDSKVTQLPFIGFFYRKHERSMIQELVSDQQAFEKTKSDMLIRHRDKWLTWSFNYLTPLLEQMQYYRNHEHKLASNPISRYLLKLARAIVNAS
ncbi:MAG TPA: glycosyltransferase family A protein [Phnomibacter sp.]|nr:glycosyltransferase family A protein [Phnomibacter sp.]